MQVNDKKDKLVSHCKSCDGQLFSSSSKLCQHCGAYQNWMSRVNLTTTTLALITALFSVATMFFAQVFPLLSSESVNATIFNIENDQLILAFNNDTNDIAYLKGITLIYFSEADDGDYSEVNLGINNIENRVISPRSTNVLEVDLSDVSSATLTDLSTDLIQNKELRKDIMKLVFFSLYPHRISEVLSPEENLFEFEEESEINCKVKIDYSHDIRNSQTSSQEFIEVSAAKLPSGTKEVGFDSSLYELAYASQINASLLLDVDGKGFKFVSKNLCSEIIYVGTMKKAFDLASLITNDTPKVKPNE